MNEGGEISAGEHCFISDHEIVKKKFCLDHNGRWNPTGEWSFDNVRIHLSLSHTFSSTLLSLQKTQQIRSNKEQLCMETDGTSLKLSKCNEANESQKWRWRERFY